ncbi:hypothetical protein ABZU32_19880 [Sphaerisporangium sp. NPDC005288]|uniref:hypothetical protein n=1 Tax=Sphaerisporangium sp. NPDC005288 TaxID=3155114 RepID=UPI00339F1807
MSQKARTLHAQLHLLDRQVVHAGDGRLVCKVDDVELAAGEDGRPYATAILSGPLALGPRIGGVAGRLIVATTELFRPEERPAPQRIPMALVSEIGSAVQVSGDPPEAALERWVREHLIAPIPGSDGGGEAQDGGDEEPPAPRPSAEPEDGNRTRLAPLLGRRVLDADGAPVGQVADVQLTQDGPLLEGVQNAFQVSGLIVVPRHTGQLFGYERGPGGQAPALVKTIIRRLHRGSRYVAWPQLASPLPDTGPIRLSARLAELSSLAELYERDTAG